MVAPIDAWPDEVEFFFHYATSAMQGCERLLFPPPRMPRDDARAL